MSDNRPWLKQYPSNVPMEVTTESHTTVVEMISDALLKYKDSVAYLFMGKNLTFQELDRKSAHFATYLQTLGLKSGDRIALMMPNCLQFPIALIGALRAGLIVVNTNPLYTPREMKHQFCDSGAVAVVIAENFAANLEQIIAETPIKHVVVTAIGDQLGLKGILINFVVRVVKKMVPRFRLPGYVGFNDALAIGTKNKFTPHRGKAEDTIVLQYTGGTTGVSKGAELTNRNLLSNMYQIKAVLQPHLREGEETVLCALPLYHIFAFTVNCMAIMSLGGKNLLIVNAKDIKAMLKEMKNTPCTLVTGVNTLFNAMMNHPDFSTIPVKQMKIAVGGGMAVQKPVALRWKELTGCQLSEGYGLTESSPVLSINPLGEKMQLGTIGIPLPSTEMRVVGESGNPLPQGEIGEIQAKGPQIMKGYWQRPEATAEVIKDGWLSTGDIGLMQPDGFFKIVDRKKDMILVSGFNVYPNEIEEVLASHPKVLESAAIGIADEKSGELVKVFVVKRDASLTKEELIEHCRANLTGYKVPKAVEFRTELPKTNVGKILRRELR